MAELARGLERLFGAPRDVEWAYADGELYVLQARPITALPEAPRPIDVAPPEGTWERDDHHAVLSPLGWDWLAPYFEAMARAMGEVMPVKEVRTANIGGQLYTQMVMEGGGGAPPPRLLLWLASRLVPAMRRANRKRIDLLEREDYLTTLAEWTQRGRAELARATDELFDPEPGRLTDDELLARIDEVLAHTARGLSLHAELHGPSLMGLGKLALFLEDELGWEMDRALALVTGASSSTTELHRSLEALVAAHHEELGDGPFPATWGELVRRAPGLGGALAAWLSKNHLRMLHYDPKHATLGERPEVVLSIVESVVASRRQSTREPQAAADDVLARARAALRPELHRELDRLLENARRSYALRDENGVETVSRPAGLLRHYVLELGRRLPLEAPEHAVYLQVREHRPALARELSDLRELVARRRGEESWAERNRGPRRYGPPPGPMPDPTAFPRGLCRMMRVFSWMMAAEALPEATPGAGPLRGVGIGHRVVTGRARVLERAEELATLRHGEILVCRITSPEWSVALGRVSAIVTDEGALLSHPAIIAREYGVTAVVGTSLATRAIATGDTVRVDPLEATVTVVRPAGARAPA